MSEKLEVIVAGVTYDLSDKVAYWHMRSKGFGLADSKRLMLQGPLQHGASDVGYRLQPRKLQLVLLLSKDTEAAYWAGRDALLRLFRPADALLKLRFTAGSIVRQIDCAPLSVDLDSGDRRLYDHIVPVELSAPDPSWYDPNGVTVNFGLLGNASSVIVKK